LSKGSSYLIPASKYPLLHHQRCEWPVFAAIVQITKTRRRSPPGAKAMEGGSQSTIPLYYTSSQLVHCSPSLFMALDASRESRIGSILQTWSTSARSGSPQADLQGTCRLHSSIVLSNTDPRQRPESCPARPIAKYTEAGAIPATRYIRPEMGPAARNLLSTPASRLRAFAVSGFHVTALLGFSCLSFIEVDC
jgi:hypothetical protein